MTRVTLKRPWICFDLGQSMQVLSWAVNRPGLVMARHILWREVRNSDLPPGLDVESWYAQELAQRTQQKAVGLLTSRDLRHFCEEIIRVEQIEAHAVATVGLSNAERIGSRMDYGSRDWGTINIGLRLSEGLTEPGLYEAMSVAVQARTAAVIDAGIALPGGVATGTGTDCIALAAPVGGVAYAGLHTALGEAIGAAVYKSVYRGAVAWKSTNRRADHA